MVRNRLEQLRKRQRDEAIQAQLELLAGVKTSQTSKNWGGDMHAEATAADETGSKVVEEPFETYDRSMSPPLLDIKQMPYEDRQIEIVKPIDDLRALVRYIRYVRVIWLTQHPTVGSSTISCRFALCSEDGAGCG